jgi:hypothetical protein
MARRRRCWSRWVTLAMLAHAFLVVAALLQRIRHPPPPELIPLTCNQVSHLFVGLATRPLGQLAHRLRWSLWHADTRRARTCHHRRQATWTHQDHDPRLED